MGGKSLTSCSPDLFIILCTTSSSCPAALSASPYKHAMHTCLDKGPCPSPHLLLSSQDDPQDVWTGSVRGSQDTPLWLTVR